MWLEAHIFSVGYNWIVRKKHLIFIIILGVAFAIVSKFIPKIADIRFWLPALLIFAGIVLTGSFLAVVFHKHILKGAPYLPTVELSSAGGGVRIVDLGCGDGRVMVALAKKGAFVCGYEINPLLVLLSRLNLALDGVSRNSKVFLKSYWGEDLSDFDVVVIYGALYTMKELGTRVIPGLTSGTKILSNRFPVPGLKEVKKVGEVFLYEV